MKLKNQKIIKLKRRKKKMFFIGDLRRFLMLKGIWKWNAIVRDTTAKLEGTWLIRSKK